MLNKFCRLGVHDRKFSFEPNKQCNWLQEEGGAREKMRSNQRRGRPDTANGMLADMNNGTRNILLCSVLVLFLCVDKNAAKKVMAWEDTCPSVSQKYQRLFPAKTGTPAKPKLPPTQKQRRIAALHLLRAVLCDFILLVAANMSSSAARKRGRTSSSSTASKKRDTSAADDAEDVLVKCRELRDDLRDKKLAPVVEAVNVPKNIVEVAELSSTKVLEGIENVALQIAQQVLNKQGFSMDIPSRAASNQVYVKEWDRIVLGGKRSSRNFLNVKVRQMRSCVIVLV